MDSILQSKNEKQSHNPYEVIVNLMNQPDFRMLFEKYFNDFGEIKSVILIMKTYHYLEKVYMEKFGEKPTKTYMAAGIRKLMADSNARRYLVETTNSFISDEGSFEELVLKNMPTQMDLIGDMYLRERGQLK